MPLPPEHSSMIPTQQSKVMNRKAWVVLERERGEDNDGNNDFDNDNIGEAEAVARCNDEGSSGASMKLAAA